MIRKLLVLTGIKIILLSLFIKSDAKLRMIYNNGHDALFVARCEAKCWKVENRGCIKGCLSKPTKKPGTCPQNITTLSPFARVCLHSCQIDSQCPGLEKCCQHTCGVTCQEPENLDSAVGVPEIPKDLRIVERRKRTIHIEWSESSGQTTTVFLIEQHHHTGKHFTESKLSKWAPIFRTNKTGCVLKKVMKPGNWYQFRVAAVNENGTRGYSESSLPFSISVSPKPPKAPPNVTVGPLFRTKNGSINVELRWVEPTSDLAIERYKVFWSIRLHGIKALDSVLVRHQIVPKIICITIALYILHNKQVFAMLWDEDNKISSADDKENIQPVVCPDEFQDFCNKKSSGLDNLFKIFFKKKYSSTSVLNDKRAPRVPFHNPSNNRPCQCEITPHTLDRGIGFYPRFFHTGVCKKNTCGAWQWCKPKKYKMPVLKRKDFESEINPGPQDMQQSELPESLQENWVADFVKVVVGCECVPIKM